MTDDQPDTTSSRSQHTKRLVIPIAVATFIAVTTIAFIAVADNDGDGTVPAPSATPTVSAPQSDGATLVPVTPTASPNEGGQGTQVVGVGDAVEDGGFEFTVTDVESAVTSVGTIEPEGSFTLVTVLIRNISGESLRYADARVGGIDTDSKTVAPHETATATANENTRGYTDTIDPGNSVLAVVVFDMVDGGPTLDQVTVHHPAGSSGAVVTIDGYMPD